MPPYTKLGSVPPKRHIEHPQKPGYRGEGIYYEEVVTTAGFSRAYSIAYHLRPPTRVKKVEAAGMAPIETVDEPALRHHHLKTMVIPKSGDPIRGRVALLTNADVTLSRCRPAEAQAELYRNATADEVIFIHRGRGVLNTMFGSLPFKPFDYIVVPRCTTYELKFDNPADADMLVIESAGMIEIPPRYLNNDGQLRLGAPYYERDFHAPRELLTIDREQDVSVLIKDGARLTRYVMAHHPFDLVGWDGMLYPFTFNADDFEPITGTIHQPPPVQQTFESKGFVV